MDPTLPPPPPPFAPPGGPAPSGPRPSGPAPWGPAAADWSTPGPAGPPPPTPPPSPPGGRRAESAAHEPDDGPDRSRTGAVWVTGTGAFLLLAAAGVFVAVRWERLGDEVKVAILGALTGGFLLAGRRLRQVIPATGSVLFHLGALLIPFNTATLALHAELDWGWFLLVEGVTATVAWFLLDRVDPSPVLRWGAGAAFVAAAAGAASVAGLPTPLVLALAALVAQQLRAPMPALGWSMVAGLGPVLVFTDPWIAGSEVAAVLGLAPTAPGAAWVVSGAVAAVVLGREARQRGEVVLVVPAAASLALGAAATWTVVDPSGEVDVLGAAAVFLLVEIAAGLVRRDPFWNGPARATAVVVEVIAALAVPGALVTTGWWFLDGQVADRGRTAMAVAALVSAAAWLVGDLRRIAGDPSRRGTGWAIAVGSGWWPATFGIAAGVLVGVALATGSSLAVGVTMVVLAAASVVTGRPAGHAIAVVLATLAPLLASFDVVVAPGSGTAGAVGTGAAGVLVAVVPIGAIALAGSLVLAAAAVVRARLADRTDNRPIAWMLAIASLGPIVLATAVLLDRTPDLALLLAAAAAAWVAALVLDRAGAGPRGIPTLGSAGRFGALLVLAGAGLVGPRGTMALAGALATAFVLDAVRLRSEVPLLGLAVALPVLVGAGAADLGLAPAETGLALTLLAAVAAGGHLLLGDRRGWPLLGVTMSSGAAGFGLAATETRPAWLAVLVLAGVGLAYATVHRTVVGAGISAGAAVVAIWGLLEDGGVQAFDAYVAPVAAVLAIAGVLARRSGRVSSWVAYGPAIVLLGGSALFERIDGGDGIHALVAATVAALAVVVGGARRLAAPLLLGTALLVAVTLHESLSVTRQVPTWGWLALGGSVLVAAGILMERRDTNPIETGRRLVDVVGSRFS